MGKKDQYFEKAESLFTIEQLTILEIAEKLPISEQTVRNWSKQGEWKKKRLGFLDTKDAFDKELYDMARVLARSIRESLDKKEEVAPSRFYSLTKVLDALPKAKKYENEKLHSGVPEDKEVSNLDQAIKLIEKELMGF